MKELEKTKRISIAAVLSILVIMIALLAYKIPKNLYKTNTKNTLEKVSDSNLFVSLENLDNENFVLIDIRNANNFQKGHLENAVNIYAPEILNDENISVFEELKINNKTAILYGNNPNEAVAPFMVLMQLGYDNLKVLKVENSYNQNQLITKNVELEKPVADINLFIEESIKKAAIKPKPKVIVTPKKVIPVKKKKKSMPEGGC